MADAVALFKRVMKPEAYGHLFCYALHVAQWYKILSGAREEEDSERNGGEGIVTEEVEGRKKAVF